MKITERKLVVVSNRLPFTMQESLKGWEIVPSSGGLVTALSPILKNRGGLWIGWPGLTNTSSLVNEQVDNAYKQFGYELKMVPLSEEEMEDYYYGFSNQVIWPLFHNFQSRCEFLEKYWKVYQEVNRKFAHAILENTAENDFIWVHDYQLMTVGAALKSFGVKRKTGFFLHIPFPPLETFLKLPWRAEILTSLLQYELVGFQTMRDQKNFIQCLDHFQFQGLKVSGEGAVVEAEFNNRKVRIGTFPISINYKEFKDKSATDKVQQESWYFHEKLPERKIILGIDRLDYTKGIPDRILGISRALEKYPELRGKITFLQVVVPSREEVPEYQELKVEIERLVGEINGIYSQPGWVPIQYFYRRLTQDELLSYYRASEIALITPLRDGMNLIAKEYCASSLAHSGALILSEFAGAAAELGIGAILVNPYDIEGLADAIRKAVVMPEEERRDRMQKICERINKYDIFWWVDAFLKAGFEKKLADFPIIGEEPVPNMEKQSF